MRAPMKHYRLLTWWEDLPQRVVKRTKGELLQECDISEDILWNWLHARTEVPNSQLRNIERAAGAPIFEIEDYLFSKTYTRKTNKL